MNGQQMAREMAEQPGRLRELVGRAEEIGDRVRALRPAPLHGVTIVARGSSDHAATYGRYLLEPATARPVSLAAPSLHTLYHVDVDYCGQLVVGVSQSGRTPEIVTTLGLLRDAGGSALAITNEPHSELARAAGAVIELGAGMYAAAAQETALKVKETCSLPADGYSSADLRHGPIAAVTRGFPVVALTAPGPAHQDLVELAGELRARGAAVLTISCDAGADVPLPLGVPEALAPIAAVVRGQQLAHALALRLGYDPDTPEGLSKVTAT